MSNRTINFYTFIDGCEVSFKQNEVGERYVKIHLYGNDGSISRLDSSAVEEDDETAKRFLHGLIDGFFAEKKKVVTDNAQAKTEA